MAVPAILMGMTVPASFFWFEFFGFPTEHALWISSEDNQRLVNGNDGGVNVSFDGGKSWSRIDNQPTAQFCWVTTDNRLPYRVYGAQQDNSTVSMKGRHREVEDRGAAKLEFSKRRPVG